jgi:hypothetical protein
MTQSHILNILIPTKMFVIVTSGEGGCVCCSISCMDKMAELPYMHAGSKEAKLQYSFFTLYFVTECQRHLQYAQL